MDTSTWQIEWGKLALIALLMTGGFVLVGIALLGHITDDRFAITLSLGSTIISAPMGYLFGNGRLASKGQPNVPTLQKRQPYDDAGFYKCGQLYSVLFTLVLMAFAGLVVLVANLSLPPGMI